MVRGNRPGPLPLRWLYVHMLAELAQHCVRAGILRDQPIGHQRAGVRSRASWRRADLETPLRSRLPL
jgi:hypothetical protein